MAATDGEGGSLKGLTVIMVLDAGVTPAKVRSVSALERDKVSPLEGERGGVQHEKRPIRLYREADAQSVMVAGLR